MEALNTYESGASTEPKEHVEAMLEKAEQIDKNNNPDRPDWLPEKFNTPEDLVKSYSELERKQGKQAEPEQAEQEEEQPQETEASNMQASEVAEVLDKVGLDLNDFQKEYDEVGGLTDASYTTLEKAGFPRSLVDSHIQGQAALAAKTNNEVYSSIGGEENYNKMLEWASDALSASEIEAYNTTVGSGNHAQVMMAVQGLSARFNNSGGAEPTFVQGSTGQVSGDRFESVAQLKEAMKDPRYGKDPAYNKALESKLQKSNIF